MHAKLAHLLKSLFFIGENPQKMLFKLLKFVFFSDYME